jgi:hypothetical protein
MTPLDRSEWTAAQFLRAQREPGWAPTSEAEPGSASPAAGEEPEPVDYADMDREQLEELDADQHLERIRTR